MSHPKKKKNTKDEHEASELNLFWEKYVRLSDAGGWLSSSDALS